MKRFLTSLILGSVALSCLTPGFATSIDFEAPLVAFSSDKQFKFEVLPPRFKNRISYHFFQSDDFFHLTHSEGPEVAKSSAITGNLFQDQKGSYVLIWSRPLVSRFIPSRALLLGTGTDIVAIVDGQRREDPNHDSRIPFSLYGFNGSCLTNGFYPRTRTNKWSLNGTNVELHNDSGRSIIHQLKVSPSPAPASFK